MLLPCKLAGLVYLEGRSFTLLELHPILANICMLNIHSEDDDHIYLLNTISNYTTLCQSHLFE